MVIDELIYNAAKELADVSESPRLDAVVIMQHCLSADRTYIVVHDKDEVSPEKEAEYIRCVNERKNGKPIAYIIEKREFMSLEFDVCEGVLIPRADTEILCETVINACINKNVSIADLCCGSGAIGVSLAYYLKNSMVDMYDISNVAVSLSAKNSSKLGVKERTEIFKLDVLNCIPNKKYDVCISNPPYIETDVINTLETDVKDYEPHLALDGGDDGLVFYRRIAEIAPQILNKGGILAFEIGYNQAYDVCNIMSKNFINIKLERDLGGNNRVVWGMLKN